MKMTKLIYISYISLLYFLFPYYVNFILNKIFHNELKIRYAKNKKLI